MFKLTFSTILASTALLAQESAAITQVNMNDPLSLSQVQSSTATSARAILQNALGAQTVQPQQVTLAQTVVVKDEAVTEDLTSKKNQCVTDVTANFFAGKNNVVAGVDQFNSFVNTVCPGLDLRIPNGVQTAACFHSGYFLLKTLRPLADAGIQDGGDEALNKFNAYVDDFCTEYIDVFPERTLFVKTLKEQINDVDAFSTTCTDHLASHQYLNTWFDPIDPLSSITQREICDLHYKLFASLAEKQRSSLAEYTSFSYLASLDLFLNAQGQEDYENCINQEVVAHPSSWLATYTTEHPAFKNWDATAMLTESGNAATAVTEGCSSVATCSATGTCPTCNGCSIAIARIYKTYEEYLNNLFAETFKTQAEAMFDQLHQANLAIETVN